MQQRFETMILVNRMFNHGDTVIAAVSGGADSVCLLRLLLDLSPKWQLQVHVAHLHHQLRGADADADAEFVVGLARQWGCPVHIERTDVAELAAERGKGIEEAGRYARYRFFISLANQIGAQAVAIGHHVNDQAETVLLRLLRGTGATGLGAISPVRDLPGGAKIVRPLIDVERSEIERFLSSQGIPWCEDVTNAAPDYLRNRIRHELLPQLCRQYNPRLPQALAHTADILQAEDAYMEAQVDRLLPDHLYDRFGLINVTPELIRSQPLALQRRLLRRLTLAATGQSLEYEHIAKLLEHILGDKPSWRYTLPSKGVVVASQGRLFFLNQVQAYPSAVHHAWHVPGDVRLPLSATRLTARLAPRLSADGLRTVAVDPGLVSSCLTVRSWHPGDMIALPGLAGRKKLSDLFIDHKIPLPHRQRIPIVTTGSEVVWVVGLMLSGNFRPAPEAKMALLMEQETYENKEELQ